MEGRRVSRALQGSIENVSVGGGALLSDLAVSGRSEKPLLPCKPGGYSGSGWEENQLISVINLRHLLGAMQGSFGSDITCFKSSKKSHNTIDTVVPILWMRKLRRKLAKRPT